MLTDSELQRNSLGSDLDCLLALSGFGQRDIGDPLELGIWVDDVLQVALDQTVDVFDVLVASGQPAAVDGVEILQSVRWEERRDHERRESREKSIRSLQTYRLGAPGAGRGTDALAAVEFGDARIGVTSATAPPLRGDAVQDADQCQAQHPPAGNGSRRLHFLRSANRGKRQTDRLFEFSEHRQKSTSGIDSTEQSTTTTTAKRINLNGSL